MFYVYYTFPPFGQFLFQDWVLAIIVIRWENVLYAAHYRQGNMP